MNLLEKALSKLGPLGSYAYYAHGYFAYPKLEGELGNKMMFKGKEKLVWSLNNYLGLANCPDVRKADEEGVKQYGLAYPMGAPRHLSKILISTKISRHRLFWRKSLKLNPFTISLR